MSVVEWNAAINMPKATLPAQLFVFLPCRLLWPGIETIGGLPGALATPAVDLVPGRFVAKPRSGRLASRRRMLLDA